MNMRERCERAEAYRKNGANCAQALLAAFADVMGITETQALAVGAGLGGGVRSGNICGAGPLRPVASHGQARFGIARQPQAGQGVKEDERR